MLERPNLQRHGLHPDHHRVIDGLPTQDWAWPPSCWVMPLFFGNVIYANNLPAANQKRDDVYIQDTWRVTPKFTAVLGLRYDYIGFPTSPFPAWYCEL